MIEVPNLSELAQTGPVIILIATIGTILLTALFFREKTAKRYFFIIFGIGLSLAALSAFKLFPLTGVFKTGRILNAQGASRLIADTIIFDSLFLFLILFLSVFLIGIVILAATLWRKHAWEWPIFLSLLLGSLVGMILLAATENLLFFAIAFELASAPSYILVGFQRFSKKSAEGSAKYVIFGAVCSALMLYGISLLYGLSGSFHLHQIASKMVDGFHFIRAIALLCLFVGIGFKIALVPMHFWSPDAYEAAGADVAAWLSVASKGAALIALARFVQILILPADAALSHLIVQLFSALAILSMTVANLSAYWQTSVKRLLAYSSIAHAGYIVTGITVLPATAGVAAMVAYIVVYMLMNLGAFAVTGLLEQQTGSDSIEKFAGLSLRNPALSACMMFFLFSLVGLPPLAGFAVKWMLLGALWQYHQPMLVGFILANTLFSLFYYMRLARAMYFETSTLAAVKVPASVGGLLAVCAGGLVVLFIGWGVLSSVSIKLISTAF